MDNHSEIVQELKKFLIEKNVLEISDIQIEQDNSGRTYFGKMLQAIVKFHDQKKQLDLFLKICLKNSPFYNTNSSLRLFDKEISFYSEILPRMLEFEEWRGVSTGLFQQHFASKTPLKDMTATCFGSFKIGENIYIVLKKIESEFQFPPKDGFFHDIDQINLTLKHLALFHATSYSMKQDIDFNVKFPILRDYLYDLESNNIFYNFAECIIQTNFKVLKEVIGEVRKGNKALIERGVSVDFDIKLIEKLERVMAQFVTILHKIQLGNQESNLLCHGDFQMFNVAYSKASDRVKFIDFQLIHYSSCMTDVLQYLSQVCSGEFRMKYIKEYLGTYEESFGITCQHYGVEVKDDFKYSGLLKQYKNAYPWGFVYGFIFNLQRFADEDFYKHLGTVNDSEEVIACLFKQSSPVFWDVLKTYMSLMKEAEEYDAIAYMEKLAY